MTLRRRRIGAYGLVRSADGRVLVTRASGTSDLPGVWQIPGGGVEQGEHPSDTVVREMREETGLAVVVTGVRAAVSDVLRLSDLDTDLHTDRVIYDVAVDGGTLRDERAGGTDHAAWLAPDELAGRLVMPFTAELLGLPVTPLEAPGRTPYAPPPRDRGQRFAAYGRVTDPAGRVLLTLIASGYPGAGRWHLPGGGTDHGEQPESGLLRELAEEAGQVGRVVDLMFVSHHHNPAAMGPEGHPMDWHAVRAVYRVVVDTPTEPRVTEAAGGSTVEARWFRPDEIPSRLTDVALVALARSK